MTPEWWPHADARVRYESLVADPDGELERIAEALGTAPVRTPAEAAAAVRFERLQREAPNQHFWQGRPGLWHELVPTATALAIAEAHEAHLRAFGYEVGVDPATARARWQAVVVPQDLAAAS